MRQGLLILISGASGTGKGTVVNKLLKDSADLAYSISATTRVPRPGEVDGVNYYFLTREEFRRMIEADEFLEWAEVYGNYYGTPLAKIKERLAAGQDVLLEIDTQGALQVMDKFPAGVYIFLLPPSLEELTRRIKGRGTETEESLNKRIGAAKAEIEIGRRYKYAVVNDKVEQAAADIRTIIAAEHLRVENQTGLFDNQEIAHEK